MANFTVTKAPDEKLSLTNKVFFSKDNFNDALRYCAIKTESGAYIFKADVASGIPQKKVAFGLMQRKWANLSLDQPIFVDTYRFNHAKETIAMLNVTITVHNKKNIPQDPLNSDEMAKKFSIDFNEVPLTIGQVLLFKFADKLYVVEAKEIYNLSLEGEGHTEAKIGIVTANSLVTFEATTESQIMLIGKAAKSSANQVAQTSIFAPNWDFNQLGIGGLDKEFSAIFRRTFASRMFPPAISKQLGLKHVRGILLYGPPGTGKTLMARQIGKMLNAREPKIVNGPSILDKYVGESEANIRKLFADAEEENKRMGVHSALHIIIFDEIDAICKQRGSVAGGSGVHDTVVNQLLTKMDGVDQLNNILVIGMTNRRDMIDEALLRPGRFEMQMEISLPDEDGRLQILQIHTGKMHKAGKLGTDVDLKELAHRTKNFSGAEIEGLCRAAAFTAMHQLIKPGESKQIDPEAMERLLVNRSHFIYALDNDVKPMFGTAEEELSCYAPRGVINWGESVTHALDMGRLAVKAVSESDVETYRPLTLLLEGPSKAGKTALAVEIAKQSGFPFVKICTSHKMTGFTETAKCQAMKKIFDDAAKSTLSVVIVDNIEGLIEYNPVGPRFSNFMVQAIKDLISQPLKAGRHMLVIGTTSCNEALTEQRLSTAFSYSVHVSMISRPQHLVYVLEEDGRFDSKECEFIGKHLRDKNFCIGIKHLIDLLDLVTKTDKSTRVSAFLSRLEEDAFSYSQMNAMNR